jgi:hypothetical protein
MVTSHPRLPVKPMKTDDPNLATLLRAARATPDLPPRFQQNVWRRIEAAEAPAASTSWLDGLAAMILRPRFAFVAAGVLLLAGGTVGMLDGRQAARHEAQMNYLASVAPHSAR